MTKPPAGAPEIRELDVLELPTAIAIIGMAGRFPGARNIEAFRRNLENGVESITVFSDEELIRAGVDRALLADPHYVKAAPILEDADQFDAPFFDYSPREAAIMDPQQRLFLECAWEALEDAGHAADANGSNTGVFAGGGGVMSTYLLSDVHFNPQLTGPTASLQHVGNDKDYLSTRVSYKFNLRGPSMAVLTACSTSLVAVHVACQSLRAGECDMALAGGTTVRVPQRTGYLYREGNVFSRDGHCRTFDAAGEGTVFGSGIGVVVLKRLHDALRDGDAIRAVIRGSAICNDGSENKNSYWAPHAEGQAEAMRRAFAAARVDPRTIGYVEAHGTATKRGDPTEVRALVEGFGPMDGARCALGSVKSNIGHPESAAGIAGLIKAVLSLEHRTLFPSLHYRTPNPEIDFGGAFYVNATRQPWTAGPFPRRAGVNALGIGGTNAFVILEEAPERPVDPPPVDRSCHVLALSAKSEAALEALRVRFVDHLAAHPDASLADVCFSANAGRPHFDHRLAVAATSVVEARERLAAADDADAPVHRGQVAGARPRVAFLFTGQGSQHVQMAGELYRTHAVFREAFDRCADAVAPHLDRPLASVVYPAAGESTPIDDTAFTQPALFAVEYALASLWRSWGVEPAVVVGHSVGEVVAACVSGVMSLDDGLRLIAARGRLMQALPRNGAMAALRCGTARAEAAIAPCAGRVSIAAINGPSEVVVSGPVADVEAVVADVEREGIKATRLRVSHAFHSPLMEPMLAEFERVARSIAFAPPAIPIVSNVTGAIATAEMATPEYWVRHVMVPVRFADGIAAVRGVGADVLLEVGPSPVLLGMARQCAPDGVRAWLASLRPGLSDWRQLAESLAALYACGADIDWAAFDRDYRRRRVHLPTYPFQRQRYWIDANAVAPGARTGTMRLPLLGRRLRLPGAQEIRFETQWSPFSPAYLDDHQIFDTVVVPGASHLAMTVAALAEVGPRDGCVLEDVVFPEALTLASDSVRTAQLILTPDAGGGSSVRVMSLREDADENDAASWVTHATGRVTGGTKDTKAEATKDTKITKGDRVDPAEWLLRCTRPSSGAEFYDRFWEAGYHLRTAFRWIAGVRAGEGEVLCEFAWPDLPDDPADYPIYPSLIDACFQSVFSDTASARLKPDAVYVPFSIRRFVFRESPRPGGRLWCQARVSEPDAAELSGVTADITLCDESGRVVMQIEGCQLREVRRAALVRALGKGADEGLYEVEWQIEPSRPAAAASGIDAGEPGLWIVFGDGAAVSDGLIERLAERKQRCVRVDAGTQFRLAAPDRYEIDSASAMDMRRLLEDVTRSTDVPCRGIVHLWSLGHERHEDHEGGGHEGQSGHGGRALASVLHLVQALASTDLPAAPRVWLVTRGAQAVGARPARMAVEQAPLWGLGRVIAIEHPELACVRVDLDPNAGHEGAAQLFDEVWTPGRDDQVAYRRGERYVPRLVRLGHEGGRHEEPAFAKASAGKHEEHEEAIAVRAGRTGAPFQIGLSAYGQIDNLVFRPLVRRAPGRGEVEIEVRATGLNFRDVLNALGLLQAHYAERLGVTSAEGMTFGFECAGTIVSVGEGVSGLAVGDEVIAAATHEALASYVTLRQEFVVPKPDTVSFDEAATLPLAFLTAYYGLHALAKLRRGERVLIHAAAGGVGLACVRWAQHVGAEVFATASPGKWPLLRSLGVPHVMSSRTVEFAAAIKDLTRGAGVDVVVNSLSGPFVDASFDVLARGGRFVELGKRDVWSHEQVRERRPDVTYLPFDLVDVSRSNPNAIADMLGEMVDRLRLGTLAPLPHTVFPASDVVEAFRYMAEARHTGKIVVSMPRVAASRGQTPGAVREDASYLITGGLGALGLAIANQLVEEGARHLVLTGRRSPSDEALAAIARLEQAGARVLVVQADVADRAQVRKLLGAIADAMPPLRGIVHAAGVLDDGVLLQQTWERFRTVMAPKVQGAWNLHAMTQDLPIDFFVCFSSVASLVGNAGQGNYAAANAFMDALAHHRHTLGLPALSINWGPWDEVGMAGEAGGQRQRRLAGQGFRLIAPEAGVQTFSRLLRSASAQVGAVPVDWSEFLRANPVGPAFFEKVAARKAAPKAAAREPDIKAQLAEAADPRSLLFHHVRSVVSKVLGMRAPGDLDPRARLFDLGLESLMAVELRGRFEQSLGCALRPTLLFDYPTVESLVDHLAARLAEQAPKRAPAADQASRPEAAPADDLQGLDEDEIAERLARELETLR